MDDESGSLALALDVDFTRTITFHGVSYVITVRVRRREGGDEVLVVEAEQQQTDDRWTGEFTKQYLEEITTKTGNFKKFAIFVRMLLSALQQRSDSVFVDLLTYGDLELLRARKLGQPSVSSSAAPRNNKRYLILTYAVEFDRVHYPLPLVHDEDPSPEVLKRTIGRLKEDIASLQRAGGGSAVRAPGSARDSPCTHHEDDIRELQRENADLRAALRKQTEEARPKADPAVTQKLRQDNENLRQELQEMEESYEELREKSAQEIRKLRRECKDVAEQLREAGQALNRQKKAPALAAEREAHYKRQLCDLEAVAERERAAVGKIQAKHKREMGELVRQLEKEVTSGRVLRSRNRDLQRKVAVLQAQVTAANKAARTQSSHSRAPSTTRSRTSSPPHSRANSTISSRFSSAVNSRASSRNASRDSSPRSGAAALPRGRLDTSRLYSTYDEHGVNVRKARSRGPTPTRQPSPPASRYVSPYAQSMRPPPPSKARSSASNASGYLSGASDASGRSRASRTSSVSRHTASSARAATTNGFNKQRQASPPPQRARRPSPTARRRQEEEEEQEVVVGRAFRRAEVDDKEATLVMPKERRAKVPMDARHSPRPTTARPRGARLAWDEAEGFGAGVGAESSLGLLGAANGGVRAVYVGMNGGPRDTHLGETMEESPQSPGVRSEEVGGKLSGRSAAEDVSPVVGKPKEAGGEVDATSEIGEIDRRLSALQNFLKQAKNGIITRIPPASGGAEAR